MQYLKPDIQSSIVTLYSDGTVLKLSIKILKYVTKKCAYGPAVLVYK